MNRAAQLSHTHRDTRTHMHTHQLTHVYSSSPARPTLRQREKQRHCFLKDSLLLPRPAAQRHSEVTAFKKPRQRRAVARPLAPTETPWASAGLLDLSPLPSLSQITLWQALASACRTLLSVHTEQCPACVASVHTGRTPHCDSTKSVSRTCPLSPGSVALC